MRAHAKRRYAGRISAIALVAAFALGCVGVGAASAQASGGSVLEDQMRTIVGDIGASISDDAGVLTTKVRCNMGQFGERFCIQSSMILYKIVMKAISDKKIDVTERTLEFLTLMPPRTPRGEDKDFVVMAASWDGSVLMRVDWDRLSLYAAVDLVQFVQADRDWEVERALVDVCTSVYGNPPRFCEMAKRSARR
jgi:hypothetical protein